MTADLDWWSALAETLPWREARTMRETPHSYVVRDKTLADPDFTRAVRTIRRYGEPGQFYGHTLTYHHLNGQRYWTMGAPLADTTIINRTDDPTWYGPQNAPTTRSGVPTLYDALASDYDSRYDRPECHAENQAVRQHIVSLLPKRPARVLDIGAGTGLTLDLGLATPTGYTAVDPSQGMLNELIRKYPTVTDVHPEPFTPNTPGNGYDLITALFGAASYLTPAALGDITRRLNPGGAAVLMLYNTGYWPDYYEEEPPSAAPAHAAAKGLGTRLTLTNYTIVTVTA